MSRTAVESSGEVNVRVASHFSNLPTIATDAFTSNFIVLSAGVISKTGASSAAPTDESAADTKSNRVANFIGSFLQWHSLTRHNRHSAFPGDDFHVQRLIDAGCDNEEIARG